MRRGDEIVGAKARMAEGAAKVRRPASHGSGMDVRPAGYIIGHLLVVLGAVMTVPIAADLAAASGNAVSFAVSAVLTLLVGGALVMACADGWRTDLGLRDGFLLTTGTWAIFPAFSALPMMLGAPGLTFADAYFESMSALTTTGATVIVGLDTLPHGLLLWRGLLHWIGGIGIVLMAIILLPVLNIGGMQLLRRSDFNTLDQVLPRAKEIAVSIGWVYFILTAACMLGFLWSGMSGFDALVHAMSTLSSGGMGNYDISFAAFGPAAQYVATVFMLFAAISFIRFVQLFRGTPRPLLADTQVRTFFGIYASFVVAVLAARLLDGDPLNETTLREVLFNLASVISSTGFATTDYASWSSLAVALIFCIMMIGGCSGSTAGGVKVFRYELLASAIFSEVRRLYSPNVTFTPRYQGRRISPEVMDSVIAFFMLYFLTLGIISVLLVLTGLEPVAAISGAATALGNIGPGLTPEIGPVGNFAGLNDSAIWLLSASMILGRLELMTVLVLFMPGFWRA